MMLSALADAPVLGILRGVSDQALAPLVEASVRAGLRVLELAMNTPDAERKLARLCELAAGRLEVGAGTVTDRRVLDQALGSGARFIVMPGLVPQVVAECVRRAIPVVPGAFTPTEAMQAHDAGATLIKVFPAQILGPAFFRALQGPLPHLRLLACGGVDESNVREWMSSGATAVGAGANTFRDDWIQASRWDLIEARLARLVSWASASRLAHSG